MKRILSLLAVLATVSLVAACGKKPGENPPVAAVPQTSSAMSFESLEDLETKAKAGNADAQFQLGAMYHDGQGVSKDLVKAKEFFEKSAKQGDSRAQFNLGVMYYVAEIGKKIDYAKAREWFIKAAEQGNVRAQFNLGVMYYRGEGVKTDYAEAMNYFTKSGSMGFSEAQFNVGVMYAKGEGTAIDIAQAYGWFEAARSFGNQRAAEVLKQIEAELKPAELKEVKKFAETLKKDINARVAAAVAAGTKF